MIKLPKINHPTFTILSPSTNKQIPFRMMLVKEEKILLMAKQGEDPTAILGAIKQVVNNCCLDPTFNINAMPLFELEFFFIKLRAASVSDKVEITFNDFQDKKPYQFEVDLNKVEIKFPDPAPPKVIAITPTAGITMKYPPAALYEDKEFLHQEGDDLFYYLVLKSIDQIYDGDNVYNAADFKREDLTEFLELLDIKNWHKIQEFMHNLPSLYYKLDYVNSAMEAKVIELKTLSDFFTL